MSVGYTAIQWNPAKRRYDLALAAIAVLGLAGYLLPSLLFRPELTAETLLIRSSALLAFLLLHVLLAIGPLARLDRRFLPLLYNRRHLGVVIFALGALHALAATVQFHALGDENPLVSLFTAYARDYLPYGAPGASLAHFPFEPLGLFALAILFLMAATSHDFWLRQLGPSAWKVLHLGVFVAYGLLVSHVAYGALQSETDPGLVVIVVAGVATVVGLHLTAAWREARGEQRGGSGSNEAFVAVCRVEDLIERRGKVVVVDGQRIALYRSEGLVFGLSNVCRHQGGPLGEGRIVDGCVTCPWHGWQYRARDGQSPPPFSERVETYRVRVVRGQVFVDPRPATPGTPQSGAEAGAAVTGGATPADDEFYVGYLPHSARGPARRAAHVALGLAIAVPSIMATTAMLQGEQPSGTFEFGISRIFEGVLYESLLPVLHVRLPGDGAARSFLLAGRGKHGLPPFARGHEGLRVRFAGSLVYREGVTLVEIGDASTFEVLGPAGSDARPRAIEVAGRVRLRGELVDTKCYLGVMRPATGKVHRACAARCLAGGVPPGLLVRGPDGHTALFLLGAPAGEVLRVDPQLAGRTVEAAGRLELHDGLPILRATELGWVERDG